jgi:hypothetical protein
MPRQDGDDPNNLFEMQCMWFELESGRRCGFTWAGFAFLPLLPDLLVFGWDCDSFLRQNEMGKALKKFTAIDKVRTSVSYLFRAHAPKIRRTSF